MSRWPFERTGVPETAFPNKIASDVLRDTRRYTTEGTNFSFLQMVATYHGLRDNLPFKLDDDTRKLIWDMIIDHDRNPRPDPDEEQP